MTQRRAFLVALWAGLVTGLATLSVGAAAEAAPTVAEIRAIAGGAAAAESERRTARYIARIKAVEARSGPAAGFRRAAFGWRAAAPVRAPTPRVAPRAGAEIAASELAAGSAPRTAERRADRSDRFAEQVQALRARVSRTLIAVAGDASILSRGASLGGLSGFWGLVGLRRL